MHWHFRPISIGSWHLQHNFLNSRDISTISQKNSHWTEKQNNLNVCRTVVIGYQRCQNSKKKNILAEMVNNFFGGAEMTIFKKSHLGWPKWLVIGALYAIQAFAAKQAWISCRDKWSDWRLDVNTFRLVANIWRMDTDLFAASWNSQLPRFISWGPHQSGAITANAFSVSWKDVQGYASPPPFPWFLDVLRSSVGRKHRLY